MKSHSSAKYKVYRVAVVVFGAVFAFFLHSLVLLALPGGMALDGELLFRTRLVAVLLGAMGGIPLGRVWWRIVYVEKRGRLCRKF
jgi:hypothetical protein